MTDTATPETGPVDAPASIESVTAEFEAGGESPASNLEDVTQELVNKAEGTGDSEEEPQTEDNATEPADDAAEPQESDPQEPTYTVKVNGEEHKVSLPELLNGYSRNEDYKAKTAAVAEARREAEAVKANAVAQAKSDYASQLEETTNLFAQYDPVLAEAQRIDWATLKEQNPGAYLQAQDAVQARLTAIQKMQAQVQQARGEAQEHQQRQMGEERAKRFDTTAAKIVETMPELADEAKFTAFAQDAVGFLRNEGFSSEEITDVLDDRVLKLADKAKRWDAHVAAQKSLPERRVVPKSAVKPLTSDGAGSHSQKPRFPGNASREAKGDWIARQILSEE